MVKEIKLLQNLLETIYLVVPCLLSTECDSLLVYGLSCVQHCKSVEKSFRVVRPNFNILCHEVTWLSSQTGWL